MTCCSHDKDRAPRGEVMQQLGRNLGLLFMLPLNRLYNQTQYVGKDSSVLPHELVTNGRIMNTKAG